MIEPDHWEMQNWRFAMLAAAVCNAVYATIQIEKGRRRPKLLTPADFYPPLAQKRSDDLTPEQREHIERKKRGKRRHNFR